jgi:hypothetical protein
MLWKSKKQSLEPPKLGELLIKTGESDAKEIAQALRAQRAQSLSPQTTVSEAIKVDANRLEPIG